MPRDYLDSAAATLAMSRLRLGLVRRIGGWAPLDPDLDHDDITADATVAALARRGVVTISADGRHAHLR